MGTELSQYATVEMLVIRYDIIEVIFTYFSTGKRSHCKVNLC